MDDGIVRAQGEITTRLVCPAAKKTWIGMYST